MAIIKKRGRTFYTRKNEALKSRRKGDRIYYNSSERAYYIKRPKQPTSFWRFKW